MFNCSEYQNALPTSGVELAKQNQPETTSKMFEDYVQARVLQNWKFWIVSFMFFSVLHVGLVCYTVHFVRVVAIVMLICNVQSLL